DHGGLKARALLVREDHQRHGVARADLVVVQRPDRLEAAEDAELAVVLAARRHGVHVRAHQDGRQPFGAGALTKDVPHLVHRHAEARLAHAGDHPITPAPVVVGQGEAGEAAPWRLADLAQLVDELLESLPVDSHAPSGFRGAGAPPSEASLQARSASRRPPLARCASVSAWRTFCSTMSTVTPSPLIARTVSKIFETSTGGRPSVGSSSMST